jgi:hypothetical protein
MGLIAVVMKSLIIINTSPAIIGRCTAWVDLKYFVKVRDGAVKIGRLVTGRAPTKIREGIIRIRINELGIIVYGAANLAVLFTIAKHIRLRLFHRSPSAKTSISGRTIRIC